MQGRMGPTQVRDGHRNSRAGAVSSQGKGHTEGHPVCPGSCRGPGAPPPHTQPAHASRGLGTDILPGREHPVYGAANPKLPRRAGREPRDRAASGAWPPWASHAPPQVSVGRSWQSTSCHVAG